MFPPDRLESVVHQFALPRQHDVIEAAVEEPDGRAANGASVLGGQSRRPPASAPARSSRRRRRGGNGDGGPAMRMQARQLPGAVAAHGKAGEIGARRVAVKLGGLLIERGHGQIEHGRIGPVSGLRALRHHDHEGPAVGVVAHRFGEADLRLPHSFGAALAAAMQEEDDGPFLAVVAPPILGQVNLKAVSDAVELDAPVQESRILRGLGPGRVGLGCGYDWQRRARLRRPAPGRPRTFEISGDILPIIIMIRGGIARKFLAATAKRENLSVLRPVQVQRFIWIARNACCHGECGFRRSLRFSYKLRATIEPAMLTEVMTKLEAGDTLDHYRLDAEVARSGMSTLFRATDLRTGRQVAVKVPHPEMEADPVLSGALPARGGDRPGDRPSRRGEDLRRGRAQPPLHGDRVGRGPPAARDSERGRQAARRPRRGAHAGHLRRARQPAQARRGASRPEAGKHHGAAMATASRSSTLELP